MKHNDDRLLLSSSAALPAVVVKDIAVGALPPGVRLSPISHVREISTGMVVRMDQNVVHSDYPGHTGHD